MNRVILVWSFLTKDLTYVTRPMVLQLATFTLAVNRAFLPINKVSVKLTLLIV